MQPSAIRYTVAILAIAAAVVFTVGTDTALGDTVLYDVDFGTPPHTVGLPPIVGAGPIPRNTVSSVNFGTPTVVSSLGPLVDQPLDVAAAEKSTAIALDLVDLPSSSFYTFESELSMISVEVDMGAVLVSFGTSSQSRDVAFVLNGNFGPTIWTAVPAERRLVGTFTFGEIVDLRVVINLAADKWTIFLDNVLAYTADFGATEVTSVWISGFVGASAGIDNIVITATLPASIESTSWGQIKRLYR